MPSRLCSMPLGLAALAGSAIAAPAIAAPASFHPVQPSIGAPAFASDLQIQADRAVRLASFPADTLKRSAPERAGRPIPYPVVPSRGFLAAVENGTRTLSGRPGPAYWQQWTDYRLSATLRPHEQRLYGRAQITYYNRSADSLPVLYLHLMQNVHATGVMRNRPQQVTGGVALSAVRVGEYVLSPDASEDSVGYAVGGSLLRIVPPGAVLPGDSVELELEWTFQVPKRGAGSRMGWDDDDLFFIAYWYPQMAVYDDVSGWQIDPFLGGAEPYAGFGSYDLTVELPAGWIVVATGRLGNPEETLDASVLARLRQAETSDSVVRVVSEADLAAGRTTRRNEAGGPLIWRFRADTVRDVAFSATRASVWDAVRTPVGDRNGDGRPDYARVDAVYRPTAVRWANGARYGRHAIDFLSRYLAFPYPWSHMSMIEGGGIIGGGMEFPMMTLIGDYEARSDSAFYYVTAHELGHMWMPMIVASDERRHAWQDEGLTSFNENQARTEFFPGANGEDSDREAYLEAALAGEEGEMMRWTDYQYPGRARTASYSKPSTVLAALQGLLGPDVFLPAYREYIHRWAFRHPTPWDFFDTIEDVTGRELGWFWRAWFYETWTLDQAVADVRPASAGAGTEILIRDLGLVPMPALVRVTRENGETLDLEIPVDTWLAGETEAVLTAPDGSAVVRVEIDPERLFPDIDRANNVWETAGNDGGNP